MAPLPFVASSFATVPPATANVWADNAAFSVSDDCAYAVRGAGVGSSIKLTRPIVDGQGYENLNPGARIRFVTDAPSFTVLLTYRNNPTPPGTDPGGIIRQDIYNGVGLVLVNGALQQYYTRPQGATGGLGVFVAPGAGGVLKTIDVALPYCAAVEFDGLVLPTGARLQAAAARPATRLGACGDSITQNFLVSSIGAGWNYLLAAANDWQLVNLGYGGRVCVASDGATYGTFAPDVATYLIFYNNFVIQTPLAPLQAELQGFISGFRAAVTAAGKPNVKLYVISPIYSPNTAATYGFTGAGVLELSDYRDCTAAAVTAAADPYCLFVDGLSIMTNDDSRLSSTDFVHPNDLGASEMATNLQAIVLE